jgi:hypothetical protein
VKTKTDFYDYTDPSLKPGKVDPMGEMRDSGKPTRAPKWPGNSHVDVTEYRPDSEKRIAKVLRQSQSMDGLGAFSSKSLRGKKM